MKSSVTSHVICAHQIGEKYECALEHAHHVHAVSVVARDLARQRGRRAGELLL